MRFARLGVAVSVAAIAALYAACGVGSSAGGPAASPSGVPHSTLTAADVHGAPDLEALLPAEVDGITLTRASYTGQTLTEVAGFDSTTLERLLDEVGADTDDLTVGIAGDPSGRLMIAAIRVDGVTADEIVDFFVRDMDEFTFQDRAVAGKTVTTTQSGGIYFYPSADVMFEVVGEGALAEDAIAQLP